MSLTVTNMINFVLVIDEEMRKHKMCFSENGIDKYEILRILPCVKELQIAVKNIQSERIPCGNMNLMNSKASMKQI